MLKFSLRPLKAAVVRLRLPVSSRRLLLIALFSLVGLMGATLIYTSRLLESLTTATLAHSDSALALADHVRALQDLSISMERSGRQYVILGDARLLRDVEQALAEGRMTARRLGTALPVQERLLTARWITLADSAAVLLRAGPAATDAQKRRMSALFRELGEVNQQLERDTRQAIERGAENFRSDMANYRQALQSIGTWVAAVSIAAALALGLWLSWLFSELASAIVNLGDHKKPAPPPVGGPTDMHALALHIHAVKQTLQALEKDKELFMRHISHELKTPLANLREGIALLEDGVTGSLNGEQRRIAGILSANANSLHQQIDDLLQYNTAAFAADRLVRRPIDIGALIRDVLAEQRLRCDARSIRVEIDGSAKPVALDAGKMRVVLNNLLANAIHFSPDGGRIRFVMEESGGGLQLDCIDEGCGIAPEDRERIFDAFYQGSRQVPAVRKGTGIGLSIVRQLVEAHQGRVCVLPADVGAHFRIELPRDPE